MTGTQIVKPEMYNNQMIMKTNKIILLLTTAVIIVVFVIFSVILHHTILKKRAATGKVIEFKTLPFGDFNRLALSGHLKVRIHQGKECKVEYATATDSLKPVVNNLNGTMYIQADSALDSANPDLPVVKITMPLLLEITADQNAEIQMDFFQTDSIAIFLGAGCIFNGSNNTLKQVSFKTSGDALINISSTF
jgi:hypothetical protein